MSLSIREARTVCSALAGREWALEAMQDWNL
jgi:hypothetical protein